MKNLKQKFCTIILMILLGVQVASAQYYIGSYDYSNPTPPNPFDYTKSRLHLKGKVKSISIQTSWDEFETYEFAPNGNMTKHFSNGKTTIYEFNAKNKISQITSLSDYDGNDYKEVITFNYNAKGQCISRIYRHYEKPYEEWIEKEYSPMCTYNKIIELDCYKTTYKYSQSGSLKSAYDEFNITGDGIQHHKYSNGRLTTNGSGSSINYLGECIYTYNTKGLLISTKSIDGGTGDGEAFLVLTTYYWNSNGNVSKVVAKSKDPSLAGIDTYKYIYDSHGNWTKMTIKSSGQSPEIYTREIEYYN